MSTHSLIIVKTSPRTYTSSYINWNGVSNREVLEKHYNSDVLAKELLSFGDISELREKLHPTGKHTFEEPEKGVCLFYHRDRKDRKNPQKKGSIKSIMDYYSGAFIRYVFVWDGQRWNTFSVSEKDDVSLTPM